MAITSLQSTNCIKQFFPFGFETKSLFKVESSHIGQDIGAVLLFTSCYVHYESHMDSNETPVLIPCMKDGVFVEHPSSHYYTAILALSTESKSWGGTWANDFFMLFWKCVCY